jgi:hypothetical protein
MSAFGGIGGGFGQMDGGCVTGGSSLFGGGVGGTMGLGVGVGVVFGTTAARVVNFSVFSDPSFTVYVVFGFRPVTDTVIDCGAMEKTVVEGVSAVASVVTVIRGMG